MRGLCRLIDHLNGGIGVKRIAFGIDAFRLELLHDFRGFGPVARIGRKRHETAQDRIAALRRDVFARDRIAREHGDRQRLIAQRFENGDGLRGRSAPIENAGARCFELLNQARIIRLVLIHAK